MGRLLSGVDRDNWRGDRYRLPYIPKQMTLTEDRMHIGSALLVIWLVIGAFAAGQRGDYHGAISNCSRASTVAVTILAGPLNYAGVNPKINCTAPQPSN
jgi:hypothetical protein